MLLRIPLTYREPADELVGNHFLEITSNMPEIIALITCILILTQCAYGTESGFIL